MKPLTQREESFINLVLEHNYAALEDIEKCREIQKILPAKVFIGEIMRMHGFLTPSQYNVIYTVLEYKAPVGQEDEISEEDKQRERGFIAVLLRDGFINYQQLTSCVDLQKMLKKDGQKVVLLDILISQGFLWQDNSWDNTDFTTPDYILWLIKAGENQGKAYVVRRSQMSIMYSGKNEVYIGRVKGADIKLNDPEVSRMHCKILFEAANHSWQITDMMSSGGVYINSQKIRKGSLENNFLLEVGTTSLLIKIG